MALHRFWHSGWGMDRLYDWLFVNPFLYLARINARDFIDGFLQLAGGGEPGGHRLIARAQTGYLGWYALSMAAGLVALVAAGVLL